MSFDLDAAVGGQEELNLLLNAFYDRLFIDPLIGFLFAPHEKEKLVKSQTSWLMANLGNRNHVYEGLNLRKAHEELPITAGHFNRRHTILKEILLEFDVPIHVQEAWLKLDRGLFDMIVKLGEKKRAEGTPKKINLLD